MIGVRVYLSNFAVEKLSNEVTFGLLILSMVLLVAAGNIINDCFDVQADLVNKPQKVIVDKYIKRKSALIIYWLMNLVSLGISIYISVYYQTLFFVTIHLIIIFFLWLYSFSLKKITWIGNLLVSFLTILPIYVSMKMLQYNSENNFLTKNDSSFNVNPLFVLFMFMGMAFLLNFIREIIKDIEDTKGDIVIGAKTLPIVVGNRMTIKIIRIVLLVFPLIYLISSVVIFHNYDWIRTWPITIVAILNFITFIYTFNVREKTVTNIKHLLKLSMLIGIIYLFIPQ